MEPRNTSALQPTTATTAPSPYNVPNLERGLQVLELLLDHPNGLPQSEIVSRLKLSKTTVFRITMTLLHYGYVERDEETKTFTLSRKLLALGSKALCEKDLMSTAMDVMRQLRDAVKETVLIGALADTEFVVLEQVLGSHPIKFSIDIGTRAHIHTAAPAKAIVAMLPEKERERLLGRLNFIRYNERTIASREAFEAELALTQERGYATDRGEQLSGICCVAAPVYDRHGYPIAGIWTTGPSDRLHEADFPKVGKVVMEHAGIISARLGYGFLKAANQAA